MPNYRGAVELHKRSIKNLIHSSDAELTIRLPIPKVSTGVNPLFGDPNRETNKTGQTKGPYSCLWYDALTAKSFSSNVPTSGTGMEVLTDTLAGQFKGSTAFAELWLEDVLIDTNDTSGMTWFDKAQNVIFNGNLFTVLGSARLGMSTSAPYSIIVGLKGGLGYDD